jgi:hypothetical protein
MGRRWLSPTNDNYSCWWTTTSIVGRQPAAPSRHPNHSASHPLQNKPGIEDAVHNIARSGQVRGPVWEPIATSVVEQLLPKMVGADVQTLNFRRGNLEHDGRLSDKTVVSIKSFGGMGHKKQLEHAAFQLSRIKKRESALLVIGHEASIADKLRDYDWAGLEKRADRALSVMLIDHKTLKATAAYGWPAGTKAPEFVPPSAPPELQVKSVGAIRSPRQAADKKEATLTLARNVSQLLRAVSEGKFSSRYHELAKRALNALEGVSRHRLALIELSTSGEQWGAMRVAGALSAAMSLRRGGIAVSSLSQNARWWMINLTSGERARVHVAVGDKVNAFNKDIRSAIETGESAPHRLIVAHEAGRQPNSRALRKLQESAPDAELFLHEIGSGRLRPYQTQ